MAQQILIVDDNEQNLYMLQVLLRGHGCEAVSAANGAEALEQARRRPPDMIIADILMPVMDGFTLCRQWMADSQLKDIPFVFYTATYTDAKDEDFALSLGATRFIIKPMEPDLFIEVIRDVLKNHQTGRLTPPPEVQQEETIYLKEYNEALIRKLEDKMAQLEESNQQLTSLYEQAQQEIVERKKIETSLRKSEARLAEAQRIAHLGNWEWNIPTGKLHWSDEVYRIFGVSPQEFDATYQTFIQSIHPDDRDFVEKSIDAALNEKQPYNIECRIPRPSGEQRMVHAQAEITFTEAGQPVQMIGTIQDITEAKQLEDQLHHSKKMEAIGRLAGGIAHDFNNLLTAILGYSQFLINDLDKNSPLRQDAEMIKQAGERAAALTRQLLTFSRKQPLQPQIISLNHIVTNVEKMLQRLLNENIELLTILEPELGQAEADPGQIEQVILNLAINARDAMPQGGKLIIETGNTYLDEAYVRQHIDVEAGSYVELTVSDTGIGIDAKTQSHIFEPFFTTKSEGKGTGLGLATVHGIVKQSKGHIKVYSEPNYGATFKIYLPQIKKIFTNAKSSQAKAKSCRGTETILLVEDEEIVRDLAYTILTGHGYTVLQAGDGSEALSIAQQHPEAIHLLLSDVVMPKTGGIALASQLKAIHPETKVLLMSGYSINIVERQAIHGIDSSFINKPFTVVSLSRAVRELLDQ
ncbi:MAG TPA: response regulator [Chloroflexi bacterium]|nr:response regulator [Chloroflexota bacterium]